MTLNNTRVEEQCHIVAEFLTSQITKFITLVENDYGCIGTTEKLIFNCVHPLFHKAKVTAIREESLIVLKPLLVCLTMNIGKI